MPLQTKDAKAASKDIDECLYAVAQDDNDALERLYDLTGSAIYAFALSLTKNTYDAQDVLHETFVKVYESAHNYSSQGKPMAWLLTIAKNLCFTKFRQKSRLADISDEELEKQIGSIDNVSLDDKVALTQLLSKLTEEERVIVVMHAMSGLRHKDIAKVLEMPLATVLSKYNRALKKLQKVFKESFYE